MQWLRYLRRQKTGPKPLKLQDLTQNLSDLLHRKCGFTARIADRFSWRHLTVCVVIATVIVGYSYVFVKGETRSAFNRWRPALTELTQGTDIYQAYAFPTPPIMALVMVPFAELPGKWGMASWFLFKVLLTATTFWILYLMTGKQSSRPIPPAVVGFVLLLSLRPISGDLLHGNVNLWILWLVVLGVWLTWRGQDFLGGVLLALATACKLTPALLLLYAVWKRKGRMVAGGAVGLFLGLVLLPGSILGFERNQELLQSWYHLMVEPYLAEGRVDTEQVNQSLPALIHRLTTDCMAIKPDDGRPIISVHWINLPPSLVRRIVQFASVALLVLLAWICRSKIRGRHSIVLLHEMSLVLTATLLLSERTWKHHFVLMIPSLYLLSVAAWNAKEQQDNSLANKIVFVLCFVIFTFVCTSDIAKVFFGADATKYAEAYGAYLWGAIAVGVGHTMILAKEKGGEQQIAEKNN